MQEGVHFISLSILVLAMSVQNFLAQRCIDGVALGMHSAQYLFYVMISNKVKIRAAFYSKEIDFSLRIIICIFSNIYS